MGSFRPDGTGVSQGGAPSCVVTLLSARPSMALVCAAGVLSCSVLLMPPLAREAMRAHAAARHVCRLVADPENKFTYVAPAPPPAWSLMSNVSTSTITVNYLPTEGSWNPAARAAFAYAANIWQNHLGSSVPIVVNATWTNLGSGILGSAGAECIYRDYGAGTPGTWYHIALANKLVGRDLTATAVAPCGTHDINASFNSGFSNWYFGTNGATPAGQYDFVSVVLHELGHGLGFSGSLASDGTVGDWGFSTSYPMVYDRFAENNSGQSILNVSFFPNPSTQLHSQLTGDALYWDGPKAVTAAGTRPRLDAYNTSSFPFSNGSNYSHLREGTYPAGNPNSLMTRALGAAEAIHNPGPIALGILQDEGWSPACTYSISPTSATFPPAGGTGQISVVTQSGCPWTATSNASFISVTGGLSGSGSGTVSYTVTGGATTARTGTISAAGYLFTVAQGPTMALDRTELRFGAVNNGGTLLYRTAAQSVDVSFTGTSLASWTASSSSPWVVISQGSGTATGNRRFSVSIANSGGVLPLSGTVTATINVTSAAVANSPRTVTVVLNLYSITGSDAPFGSLDTPALASSTNLQGSVAITGWALDDVEVMELQIWRDPHPSDPPDAIYAGSGVRGGKVYIGNASFLAGARPDVETLWATMPLNYRAGWGYLMLTRGLIWDGAGSFRIYAIGIDREGKVAQVGSRLISVANAGATRPFGAIDTPGQGATVSGVYPNTGWVLTPNSGATIPASGVQVAIDGVFLSGTPSMSDRADITPATFPGFDTTGAGRGMFINTSSYADGVHTIGWLVTDSIGQADGVGSRFFTIANDSSLLADPGFATARGALPHVYEDVSALRVHDAGGAVLVQAGMNPGAPVRAVAPGNAGLRSVRIAEMDRVEIRVSGVERSSRRGQYTAYSVVRGQLRPLPIGSTLDTRRGILYWQPGAGFVGNHRFVIVETTRGRAYHVSISVGDVSM